MSQSDKIKSLHDPIAMSKEHGIVEISYSGRLLSSPVDFKRFKDREAKVELVEDESRKLKGKIS